MINILLTLLVLLIISLLFFLAFIIYPFFFGAGFEKTDKETLKTIIKLSSFKKTDKVADLGSGTGTIVVEFAKAGIEAHGFEINPLLVFLSRRKLKKLNLQNRAFIHFKNFWKADLSKFNIITIFQYRYLMPSLEKKLKRELKKNSVIISNKWAFPNLKPIKKEGRALLYKL